MDINSPATLPTGRRILSIGVCNDPTRQGLRAWSLVCTIYDAIMKSSLPIHSADALGLLMTTLLCARWSADRRGIRVIRYAAWQHGNGINILPIPAHRLLHSGMHAASRLLLQPCTLMTADAFNTANY